MKNPFLTYGYDGPEYFCDRVEETHRLCSLLRNNNHVALISPRRIGKTGLLKHCFSLGDMQEDFYLFIVDIYATKSLSEFNFELGRTILSVLKSKERKVWERFLQVVGSFRSGITLDEFGKPSWNIEIGDIRSPQITLDEIFQYLSSADKPCLVAIDEFQAIADYEEKNVEALLRTHIQNCNNARFVFSGSKRHMMGEMFSSPSRPFYQSASVMSLRPIPLDAYSQFITYHYEKNNRKIDSEAIQYIYEMFEGTTWYIQKVCNELFAVSDPGSTCTRDDALRAVNEIVEEKDDMYQDLMSRLTLKQKSLLMALGRSDRDVRPTSAQFIKRFRLSTASAVQRCLSALLEKDIITNENGRYYIHDYFLRFWLNRDMTK